MRTGSMRCPVLSAIGAMHVPTPILCTGPPGAAITSPLQPMPVIGTLRHGVFAASLDRLTAAWRMPSADGVKATLTVQYVFGARTAGASLERIEKSAALRPVIRA